MIKRFKCGLCKENDRYCMTRKDFRKHLEEKHRIMNKKFNSTYVKGQGYSKQKWVIEE